MKCLIILLIDKQILSKQLLNHINYKPINMICYQHIKLMNKLNSHASCKYYGDSEWFDWVLIKWGEDGELFPAKLL